MFPHRLETAIRLLRRKLHREAAVSPGTKPAAVVSAAETASAQALTAEAASARAGEVLWAAATVVGGGAVVTLTAPVASEAAAVAEASAAIPAAAAALAEVPVEAVLAAGHIPAMALRPSRRTPSAFNPAAQERFNFPSALAAYHQRAALPAR